MKIDENRIIIASIVFAIVGIVLLFFLSETPQNASVASAIVSPQNSLLIVNGTVENITSDKFLLCNNVCISVKTNGLPSALLLSKGRNASVKGRVNAYMGKTYMVAQEIEVK